MRARQAGTIAFVAAMLTAGGSVRAQNGGAAPSQPPGADEADRAGEIVVTATRRETDLQDTALSISALSGRQLEARGINSVAQAIAVVPGVSLLNEQPGRADLTVRGVNTSSSTISQADVLVNSTTAVYLNQLPVTSTVAKTPDFRFVDMERVEVLRGPQGTLYGQSAMGGVIRYITNRPDPSRITGGASAYLSDTEKGGTNVGADGYLNLPLTDALAVRVVGYAYRNSGFIDTVPPEQRRNSNRERTYGLRAALRWNVTDRITFDATYLLHEVNLGNIQAITSTYMPTGNPADYGRPRNFVQVDTDRLVAQHLQPALLRSHVFNAELTGAFDGFTANVIFGRKLNRSNNEVEAAELTGGTESYFSNTTLGDTHSNTLEARLVSDYKDSPVDWLAGVYYEDAGGVISTYAPVSGAPRVLVPGVFVLNPGDVSIDSGRQLDYRELAFYGEVAVHLGPRVKLTGGYRRSDIKNNYRWIFARGRVDPLLGRNALLNIDQGTREKVSTYRANLEWKASDDLLLYAQASSGFRPGGLNPGNALSATPIPDFDYGSDSLWNYEVGLRARFGGIGTLNLVGYRIDWSDIQLPTTQLVSPFYSATLNAGKARINGVEVEATVRPAKGIDLTAAYAFTDAKLKSISAAPVPGVGRPPGNVGDPLPGTARHVFTGAANLLAPIAPGTRLTGNLTYRYVGRRTSALGIDARMPSYQIVDARIGADFDNGLSLSLFADNLTNKIAVLRIIPGAPFRTGQSFQYWTINRPRTIGLRASYRY